ncbi:O-antigen ligase [Chitinophaga sp. S165]|uniref:O-antigen ligase family protein n=1 Tax=Chitinophaga sp. S165 TaxID=2135462 RepID=UPI000D71CA3C|nr:O-antigen ligase family protein [Chitinophaga sp. S165]PWV56529.1 O-antigen ligase-like membrane protein [Chitinophaga sp. S165]
MGKSLSIRSFVKNGVNVIFILFMLLNFALKYAHLSFINGDVLLIPVMVGLVFFLFFLKREKVFSLFVQFRLFTALTLCFTVYFIFLDPVKDESLVYLISKVLLFLLFALFMALNTDEYKQQCLKWTAVVIFLSCVYGTFSQTIDSETFRLSFGFKNANSAGTLAAIAFGIILQNKFFKRYISLPMMIYLGYVIFMTGSRAALVVFVIALFFSDLRKMPVYKYLLLLLPVLLLLPYIIPYFSDMNSSNAIARMVSSISGKESMFSNRDHAYTWGIKTFLDELMGGHGLARYGWTDPKFSSANIVSNPHNGYLGLGIMMGILFAGIFVLMMFWNYAIYLIDFFKHKKEEMRTYFFIVTSILIAAFVESYLVGINELMTSLFWCCLANIQFEYYIKSRVELHQAQKSFAHVNQ